MSILKKRRLLSFFFAIIISAWFGYYFHLGPFIFIPLSTLFVMQAPIGLAVSQGLLRFLFLLLILMVISPLLPGEYFYYLAHDVALGALIGILANLFIFPRKVDLEFRLHVIEMMQAYEAYFQNIMQLILQKNGDQIESSKVLVETKLLELPDWVYKRGFDAGMKTGQQFFLIKVERIADILFSMHHLGRYAFDTSLIQALEENLNAATKHLQEFFTVIIKVLNLEKVTTVNDFSEVLDALEKQFQKLVPFDAELMDIRTDYVYFAELIYFINELREILLRQMQALR